MADEFGTAPRFPGELRNYVPPRPAPRNSWGDRLRYAWIAYTVVGSAVALVLAVAATLFVEVGIAGVFTTLILSGGVVAYVYARVVVQRMQESRDQVTGEQTGTDR